MDERLHHPSLYQPNDMKQKDAIESEGKWLVGKASMLPSNQRRKKLSYSKSSYVEVKEMINTEDKENLCNGCHGEDSKSHGHGCRRLGMPPSNQCEEKLSYSKSSYVKVKEMVKTEDKRAICATAAMMKL